jgi:hypothetical protein
MAQGLCLFVFAVCFCQLFFERFHNLPAYAVVVQGGFFLMKKPLGDRGFGYSNCGTAVKEGAREGRRANTGDVAAGAAWQPGGRRRSGSED